jgi:hypothetical protein
MHEDKAVINLGNSVSHHRSEYFLVWSTESSVLQMNGVLNFRLQYSLNCALVNAKRRPRTNGG